MPKDKAAVDPATKLTAESKGLGGLMQPGGKNAGNTEAGKAAAEKGINPLIGQDAETDPAAEATKLGSVAMNEKARRDVSHTPPPP